MPVDRLESLLRDAFPDAAELRVEDRTGGGDHFQVTVESPRFDGLPLLDQHRLGNAPLAEPVRHGTIHVLRNKARGTSGTLKTFPTGSGTGSSTRRTGYSET